ncbi:hypothetical protein LCGC14_3094210, partial [marine sediment metagenome]
KTYKMGEVHEGSAEMDWMELEKERGISITAAATFCSWKGFQINIIDTPGHVDFTAEVERSLRVLDGAIGIFCAVSGVESQSETVWRQGQKYDLPCLCFINKMDKIGADFEMAVQSIQDKLLANAVPVQIPIGEASEYCGLIDLIEMRAFYFEQEETAAKCIEKDIPADMLAEAEQAQHDMIEAAAEFDDDLMDDYIHDNPIDMDTVVAAIRKGTLTNKINPVFCGAALKNIGARRLLDGVIAYLPSPKDRPPITGYGANDKEIEIVCDPDKPFVAVAFKITSDKHGDLYFLRIYQGTLKKGSRVLNATRGFKENITRIFEMHAASRDLREIARAGDIVAVVGLKDTL